MQSLKLFTTQKLLSDETLQAARTFGEDDIRIIDHVAKSAQVNIACVVLVAA
jgi:hypothetical protein